VDCTEGGGAGGGLSYDGDLDGVGLRKILEMLASPGEPGLVAGGGLSGALAMGVMGVSVELSVARTGSGCVIGAGVCVVGGT
jgi:hypothetical protein